MQRRIVSRPFEVWRDRAALAGVLRAVVAEAAPGRVEAVALTTTAELSDAFRTKREGVGFVLDAAEAALARPAAACAHDGGELVCFAERAGATTRGGGRQLGGERARVAELHADALHDRRREHDRRPHPGRRRRGGRRGRTDLDRLLAGELVYTGVLRTNLATIAPQRAGARRDGARSPPSCSRSAPTST